MTVLTMTTTTEPITLDVADRRKASRQERHPLVVDAERFDAMLAVAGVELRPGFTLIVRFTDAEGHAESGYTRQVGPDQFVVKVRVQKKDRYMDRHLYIVNNTLLHELRHVAQMQKPGMSLVAYANPHGSGSYFTDPREQDAWAFGRLCDHTGTKPTPAGKPLGWALWAVNVA